MRPSGVVPPKPANLEGYSRLIEHLGTLPDEQRWHAQRMLCQEDLFFLVRYVLTTREAYDHNGKHIMDHQFVIDRCRDIENHVHQVLDLWSREHFKSTLKTFALPIRWILRDPNVTIGIFSETRPIAKKFLRVIKAEMERNEELKALFPEIFWTDPAEEAPKWSEDDGLCVKRSANLKEQTLEAWGFASALPTGSHFEKMLVDDAITEEGCRSGDMIARINTQWELSQSLGKHGGEVTYTGTPYHKHDTYAHMLECGVTLRRFPAINEEGEPALYPKEYLDERRGKMSDKTWNMQWMVDPLGGHAARFDLAWLQWYDQAPVEVAAHKNVYILVDPSSGRKKKARATRDNDFTAIWVVGCGEDGHVYALDIVRDKLDPLQRVDTVFDLVRMWSPLEVRYESYSMAADTTLIEAEMRRRSFHFALVEVAGLVAKEDRIDQRLHPWFKQAKIHLPRSLLLHRVDGSVVNVVDEFVKQEYLAWPQPQHDDLLDCLARLFEPDMPPLFPSLSDRERDELRSRRQGAYSGSHSFDEPSWLGVM